MPIVFSAHAIFQLKKRKISQQVVKRVVVTSKEIISSYRGRKLRRLKIGGRLLEVVTKTEGARITIVTAYFLED